MKILFLGDIVGPSGCMVVKKHLKKIVEENKINFVIANGENAAHTVSYTHLRAHETS